MCNFRVTKGGFEIKDANNQEKLVAVCSEKENAAFIVRACNSHDGLVKAIEKVARILDAQDDPRYSIHHPLVKPLLEALAKAKGEA